MKSTSGRKSRRKRRHIIRSLLRRSRRERRNIARRLLKRSEKKRGGKEEREVGEEIKQR